MGNFGGDRRGGGGFRGRGGGGRDGGRGGGGFRGERGEGRSFGGGGFRSGGGGGGFSGPREMHKAVCSSCQQECEVPFKPTEGRPVYCRDCFQQHRPPRQF